MKNLPLLCAALAIGCAGTARADDAPPVPVVPGAPVSAPAPVLAPAPAPNPAPMPAPLPALDAKAMQPTRQEASRAVEALPPYMMVGAPPVPVVPGAPVSAPAPVLAPAPNPAPLPAPLPALDARAMQPTRQEASRAVEALPPYMTIGAPRSAGSCACFQPRDPCGWPVDRCGNRRGAVEITLEGSFNFTSSPEGILGEPVFGGASPQINWDGVDYKGEFGGRGTISIRVDPFSRLELRGAYYGKSSEGNSQSGFFAAFPGATGTGDVSRPVIADLASEIETYGSEFNWWTEVTCAGRWRVDTGAGLRYLHLDETARVDFTATGVGPFPIANGFVTSESEQNFIGAQGLVAVHADVTECFEAYGSFKPMLGNLHRNISVTDDSIFAGGIHRANLKDDQLVFGFDLEFGLKVQVTPRIAVTGGYDLLFLDNVIRANDAMDFKHSNTGAVQVAPVEDQLLIHTLFLGVSINF